MANPAARDEGPRPERVSGRVESGAGRRTLSASRRRWLGLAVVVVLSVAVWWVIRPIALTRQIEMSLSAAGPAAHWALEWRRQGGAEFDGRWLEFDSGSGMDVIEIRPSGVSKQPGVAFEFWLYEAKDASGAGADLKALIERGPPTIEGNWLNFKEGPGVVYQSTEAGVLRLPWEASKEAVLVHARTDRGGKVQVRRGISRIEVDTFATQQDASELRVPKAAPGTLNGAAIRERLPAYEPEAVRLRWADGDPEEVRIDGAAVVVRIFGREVDRWPLELAADPKVVATDSSSKASEIELKPGAASAGGGETGGVVELRGAFGRGRRLEALLALASLAVTAVAVPLLWRGVAGLLAWGMRWCPGYADVERIVASAIVVMTMGLALWSPCFVTPDGIDYLNAGVSLAERGNLDGFSPFKAPGIGFLIAGAMAITSHFALVMQLIHGLMIIASAAMVYAMLGKFTPRPWPLIGAAFVGLHPVLLTYQQYLLREIPATFLMTTLAWVLCVGGRRGWWWRAVVVGIVCGAGTLVRENFQTLVFLAPAALALVLWCEREAGAGGVPAGSGSGLGQDVGGGRGWHRGRGVGAAGAVLIALTVSTAIAGPWFLRMGREYGAMSLVLPKLQVNRGFNAWVHRIVDPNSTRVFEHDRAAGLVSTLLPTDDMLFVRQVADAKPKEISAETERKKLRAEAVWNEAQVERYLDEFYARAPERVVEGRWDALVSLTGLWNITDTAARANGWYSSPLRGEITPFATNYQLDVAATLREKRSPALVGLEPVIAATQVDTAWLAQSSIARRFNEFYYIFQLVRPVLGWCFVAGTVLAVLRRHTALAAVGLIVVLNLGAAAMVVMTPANRFGVPFIPAMAVVAVWGLAQFFAARRERLGVRGQSTASSSPASR